MELIKIYTHENRHVRWKRTILKGTCLPSIIFEGLWVLGEVTYITWMARKNNQVVQYTYAPLIFVHMHTPPNSNVWKEIPVPNHIHVSFRGDIFMFYISQYSSLSQCRKPRDFLGPQIVPPAPHLENNRRFQPVKTHRIWLYTWEKPVKPTKRFQPKCFLVNLP